MKNLAVVNALAVTPYAGTSLSGGPPALQRVAAYARELPGVERAVLLRPADGAVALGDWAPEPAAVEGFAVERVGPSPMGGRPSLLELLRRLRELSEGYDAIFYVFGDCPLLDPGLSASMLDSHSRYFADYTFADGYPYGLAPEILRVGALGALIALAERVSPGDGEGEVPLRAEGRQSLFELIKRDINAFEIETELSPVDLRLLRAELASDTRRNALLVERLLSAGAGDAASVCRILQDKAEVLRTLPAYVAVQIVEGCPQRCSYCPYGQRTLTSVGKQGEMALERFERVVDEVHGLCQDATIGVSLWGEPSYHSRFAELAAMVLGRGLRLAVETSGLGWPDAALSGAARLSGDIDWIVSLDSADPELYRRLRGEGREEALRAVQTLQHLFPGRVYPQAVRMKENEQDLEGFYRHWKKSRGNVIIQKYDHFCGALPDRRVTDLSPLKRFPCWHLKRDVTVLIDGRVPLCREDLTAEHPLGNIFEEPLEEIWRRGEPFYLRHLSADYPRLCAQCDEYYTFNF